MNCELVAHRLTTAKVAAEVRRLHRNVRSQQSYEKVNEVDDEGLWFHLQTLGLDEKMYAPTEVILDQDLGRKSTAVDEKYNRNSKIGND
jgi:hypothetical protein